MSYPRPELTSWSWQASVYSVLPSLSIKNKPISPELACFGELDMGFLPFSPAISHFGSIHSFTDECSMQIWTGGCGRMFLTLRCHHDPFLILVGGKGLLIFNKGLWKVRNLWTLLPREIQDWKGDSSSGFIQVPTFLRRQNPSFATAEVQMLPVSWKPEPPSLPPPTVCVSFPSEKAGGLPSETQA